MACKLLHKTRIAFESEILPIFVGKTTSVNGIQLSSDSMFLKDTGFKTDMQIKSVG